MICYFDTEFNEDDNGVFLISVGMVRSDGQSLYLVLDNWKEEDCNPWVRENVLPHLGTPFRWTPTQVANMLEDFTQDCTQYIGWCCVYDWFLLSRLFGTFFNKPDSWPTVPLDINQFMDDETEKVCPALDKLAHHAEDDARQIERIYAWLLSVGYIKNAGVSWPKP